VKRGTASDASRSEVSSSSASFIRTEEGGRREGGVRKEGGRKERGGRENSYVYP